MTTTKTKKHVSRRLRQFARANEAVSALEYAILVGVVAIAIGAALVAFSNDVQQAIAAIGGQVDGITIGNFNNPSADTTAAAN